MLEIHRVHWNQRVPKEQQGNRNLAGFFWLEEIYDLRMGVQKLSVNPGYLQIYLAIWASWTEILGAAQSDNKEQGRKNDQL